jgi:hypothetical protein
MGENEGAQELGSGNGGEGKRKEVHGAAKGENEDEGEDL